MIEIIWHGHACFEIRGGGSTIITDPFKGIGLPEPSVKADLVLCSHHHGDHSNVDPVKKQGGEVLIGFVGHRQIKGVKVQGIASFHDDTKGNRRGNNSIYVFEFDNLRFCHLGDLGHTLSNKDLESIGTTDVLFIPVGGAFTIGPSQAVSIYEKINPKIVIPMHYRMAGMSPMFNALSVVDDFIVGKSNVERLDGPVFTLIKDDEGYYEIPLKTSIVIFTLT